MCSSDLKLISPAQEQDDPDQEVEGLGLFAAMDVVLVLDVSGSMADQNPQTGKTLLSYAQDASISFARTLFALSPESRVGIVAYETIAWPVAGLTDRQGRQSLFSLIRGISWGGMTNTGDGFLKADDMLTSQAEAGRAQLVLMLTDGIANEGGSDPKQYAIDRGTDLAAHSLVYTVGMLGNYSAENLSYVRETLHAGYETRYFEITFSDMEE